jgi:RNA polymerase sigma factor (sigma-70 family)
VSATLAPPSRSSIRFPALRAAESDDDLVERVRAGDDRAFEQIYDRYARGLLTFCAHMLRSRESAEDAVQLTFVSAYRAMCSGDTDIVLRPWLYTIARNRCLSDIRARRPVSLTDSDLTPVADLPEQVRRRE